MEYRWAAFPSRRLDRDCSRLRIWDSPHQSGPDTEHVLLEASSRIDQMNRTLYGHSVAIFFPRRF